LSALVHTSVPPSEAQRRGLEILSGDLQAVGSLRTGIVSVTFEHADSSTAVAVVRAAIDAATDFDVRVRRGQGSAERRFLEDRLVVLRTELAAAEDQLRLFVASNRATTSSPTLQLERDRLQRIVTLKAALVGSLTQSFEQARIEEVRDTPTLAIVQAPESGASSARSWPLALFAAVCLGIIAAAIQVLVVPALKELVAH